MYKDVQDPQEQVKLEYREDVVIRRHDEMRRTVTEMKELVPEYSKVMERKLLRISGNITLFLSY